MGDLIRDGYLVAPEYYAPSKVDLRSIRIDKKTGDYNLDALAEVMQRPKLYGDMITAYKKFAMDLPTLLFCVSVGHSKSLADAFCEAGVRAEHLDANSPDSDRDAAIRRLETGETKILCNVGIFTTGVDIPCLKCIILARPTKSYNLFIQIVGRGTRPYPGKERFIVLDHANAISEHGFIEHERVCDLDGEGKKTEAEKRPRLITCDQCYYVWEFAGDYVCFECGFDNAGEESKRIAIEVDKSVELEKIDAVIQFQDFAVRKRIDELAVHAIATGGSKPEGWIYHQLRLDKRYGEAIAKKYYKQIILSVKTHRRTWMR
jgi:superfamily II DNA or RNA helicase